MRIDGKKVEEMSLDQIGAALQLLADEIRKNRRWSKAAGQIAENIGGAGEELRKLWCRHD